MYTLYFDAAAQQGVLRNTFTWLAAVPAGLAGLSDPRATSLAAPLGPSAQLGLARAWLDSPRPPRDNRKPTAAEQLALALHTGYLRTQDDAPLGLPLLAVRAARRAIAENPDDVGSYLVLAEAYSRLAYATRERAWGKELGQLRVVQLITALHNALEASPTALQAAKTHEQLVLLCLKLNYQDVALKHLQEQLRHTRAAGPHRGETARQFEKRIDAFARNVQEFEKAIAALLAEYEAETANLRPNDRARLALGKGLAGKALQTLLGSDVSSFGADGAIVQLDLMLTTGRAHDVRALLEEDLRGLLSDFRYHWLRAQVAAALGDYAEADRELQAAQNAALATPQGDQAPASARVEISQLVGGLLLDGLLEDKSPIGRLQMPLARANAMQRLGQLVQALQTGADVGALRGVLALERGETEQAAGHFRSALAFWGADGRRSPAGIDFAFRPVAEEYLGLIQRSAKKDRADR
jgi:Tfp pilus assembly protein PilF